MFYVSKKTILFVIVNIGMLFGCLHQELYAAACSKEASKPVASVLSCDEFNRVLHRSAHATKKLLENVDVWLFPEDVPQDDFFSLCSDAPFFPYVQKCIIPSSSTVALWGDLHGDAKSLLYDMKFLQDAGFLDSELKIIQPNFYMIFLGDLVDRGTESIEVIYTFCCLKIANPGNVFCVRGNHEDCTINYYYGLYTELCKKFSSSKAQEELMMIGRWYDMLPVALYLGSGTDDNLDFVLCAHGSVELGFYAKDLLENAGMLRCAWFDKVNRVSAIAQMPQNLRQAIENVVPSHECVNFRPQSLTMPHTLGFVWGDCIVDNGESIVDYSSGRGWAYGKPLVSYLFERDSGLSYQIRSMFRGHQHNNCYGDMMNSLKEKKGFVSLWDGLVNTIISSPTIYKGGSKKSASFVVLKTAGRYDDWSVNRASLEIVN